MCITKYYTRSLNYLQRPHNVKKSRTFQKFKWEEQETYVKIDVVVIHVCNRGTERGKGRGEGVRDTSRVA